MVFPLVSTLLVLYSSCSLLFTATIRQNYNIWFRYTTSWSGSTFLYYSCNRQMNVLLPLDPLPLSSGREIVSILTVIRWVDGCGTKAASRELGSQSAEKLIWEKCRERRIRTIRCETLCVRTFPLFFAFNGLRQNMIFFIFFAVDLPYGEGGGSVLSSYYSFLLTPTQQPNRAMFSRRTHYELKLYCKNGSC